MCGVHTTWFMPISGSFGAALEVFDGEAGVPHLRLECDERRPARVYEQGLPFLTRQIVQGDDAAGRRDKTQVNRHDVAFFVQLRLGASDVVAVGLAAAARALTAPDKNLHAERPSVHRHGAADAPVAVNA